MRTINLIEYLPHFLQSYHQFYEIMKTETTEFQILHDELLKSQENMFVVSCDVDSMNDRQIKLLAHYTNDVINTFKGLKERMDIICGSNNYTMTLDNANYTLNIHLTLEVKNLISTIEKMMKEILPANIKSINTLNYNSQSMLSKYTHEELKNYTHQALKDEVI